MQICVATCNMAEFISIFALPFPGAPGEVQTEHSVCVCVCVCACVCVCKRERERECLSVEGGKSGNLHNKLGKKEGKGKKSIGKRKTVF